MIAKRLTAQQGAALLRQFYDAWGPEQMERSYWWKTVPKQLYRGERMYSFHDGGQLVGWGSFGLNTRDADDEEAALSVGVFPEFQRQGYRRRIIDVLCEKAKALGADYMQQLVYHTNKDHYERTKRECQAPDSKWRYAGETWFPPEKGYGYFIRVLKEEKS